jgi:hypothetical protein
MLVTNLDDLKKELLKRIGETMLNVTIDAQEKVKQTLQTQVYDSYSPKDYRRTGDLNRSVDANVKSSGSIVKGEVFHNTSLMTPVAPYEGNNYVGQHYSTYKYNPMDYRQYVAETVNYGISSGRKKVFGDGVYSRPRPYFDNARLIVEKNFEKNLTAGLKSQGLKVEG